MNRKIFNIFSIGFVKRDKDGIFVQINESYRPALKQLDSFSHVIVVWWADKFDNDKNRSILQCAPPYAKDKVTGVFASRSPQRPNPVSITTCKILDVNQEKGLIKIENIDAFDETPVIDLKAYFPVTDRVRESKIPEWLSGWPEWFPDGGIGLED